MVTQTNQASQSPDQVETPQEALDHFQKVNLANAMRLMADNQSCLDQSNRRARAFLNHELSMMGQPPDMAKDDEMNIAIDSPTTHNHYHQPPDGQPQAATSALSPLMKLAAVGLIASGVGIPAGIAAWNLPALLSAKPAASSLLQDYDLLVGAPPPAAKPTQTPEGP
ncbi:MAG: hypothetical protein JSS49_07915 [Planctomycetes bacterium]|nr:hypothetical protein [Planctomycetota bacterium]